MLKTGRPSEDAAKEANEERAVLRRGHATASRSLPPRHTLPARSRIPPALPPIRPRPSLAFVLFLAAARVWCRRSHARAMFRFGDHQDGPGYP